MTDVNPLGRHPELDQGVTLGLEVLPGHGEAVSGKRIIEGSSDLAPRSVDL